MVGSGRNEWHVNRTNLHRSCLPWNLICSVLIPITEQHICYSTTLTSGRGGSILEACLGGSSVHLVDTANKQKKYRILASICNKVTSDLNVPVMAELKSTARSNTVC